MIDGCFEEVVSPPPVLGLAGDLVESGVSNATSKYEGVRPRPLVDRRGFRDRFLFHDPTNLYFVSKHTKRTPSQRESWSSDVGGDDFGVQPTLGVPSAEEYDAGASATGLHHAGPYSSSMAPGDHSARALYNPGSQASRPRCQLTVN